MTVTVEELAKRIVLDKLREPRPRSFILDAIVREEEQRREWGEAWWTAADLRRPRIFDPLAGGWLTRAEAEQALRLPELP